jgi:replicative DNA helicase
VSDVQKRGGLAGGARILRANNGSEVTLSDLVQSGERPLVWSLDERKRMVARQLSSVRAAGRNEMFAMRIASGREVVAVGDSPLLTLRGWTTLSTMKVGDRLALPRRIPAPVYPRLMAHEEIVLLAHMIGDGSCVKRQPIRYASIDEQNLDAVTMAARHFGITAVRDDYAAARVTTLRLPAPYRLARGRRNPIAAWLDGFGLFGLRSYEKFVPTEIFAMPNDQVALFLRHLWATDGCVAWDAKQGIGRIYYGSTSRRLIDDVRQLLLRFGIASRAHATRQAGYRDCWQLAVSGVHNQRRFLRRIDVHGMKFFAAWEVFTSLATVSSNENVDTVPVEIWDQVRQGLSERHMSHRAFAQAMGTKFCGSTMWKHSPSRSRLHRAAAILDDRALHDLTTDDVFWDRIVEIASIGEQDVYAVALSDADNLVAQGISIRASAGT